MLKIGVHVIVMSLVVTIGIKVIVNADIYWCNCAIFPILFGIPSFLITDISYIVACAITRKRVRIVFTFFDPLVIVASIVLWGCIVYYLPFKFFVKSMGNFLEPGLFSVLACVFYAIRCYYAYKGNATRMKSWERLTYIVIPVVAIFFAFLFPTMPE